MNYISGLAWENNALIRQYRGRFRRASSILDKPTLTARALR